LSITGNRRGRRPHRSRRDRRGGDGSANGAGRPARPRPFHPHRRRPQDQQLPALAVGLHRVVVHRSVVARARCGDTAMRAGRLRQSRTPFRPDRRAGPGPRSVPAPRHRRAPRMTRTRLLAALVMAPVAIAAILLLPTDWMMALAAVVFLLGLWEWFDLAEIEDTLARTILLVAHLALMAALVWASRST